MITFAPAVRLTNVCKRYRSGAGEQDVLIDVDLTIAAGEFVVVLGPSGSGKSTLLNLLGAMDRPSSGRVEINGVDITALGEHERTLFRRAALGFIFQTYNLIPTLSVAENVCLPLELNGISDDVHVHRLLADLGIGDKASAAAEELSGGEQQRVAIARALVHKPDLILADEPTGNLDIDTGRTIIELIDDLVRRHQRTLVVATHSRDVLDYADRVLTIKDHRLVDL